MRDLAFLIGHHFDDFLELKELNLAEFLAIPSLNLFIVTVTLMRSLDHGIFERANNLARIDALVLGDLIYFSLQCRDEHACSSQSWDPDGWPGSLPAPPQAEPSI